MKTKRHICSLVILAVACIFSFGISAFANVTKDEAIAIARQVAPRSSKMTEVSHSEKALEWECEFLSKGKRKEYEVVIDEVTGKVKKYEMEMRFDKGGQCFKISKGRAKKNVRRQIKNAVITKVKRCKDDGFLIYRVYFHGDGYTGDAEVNAQTGVVNEWTLRYTA